MSNESGWRHFGVRSDILNVRGKTCGRPCGIDRRAYNGIDEREDSTWKAKDKLLHLSQHFVGLLRFWRHTTTTPGTLISPICQMT